MQGRKGAGILEAMQEQRQPFAEEITLSRTALAFMSYVNLDDRHENGRMTQFRKRLSGEVRMQTGEPFEIFQDRKDIAWGQQWQERLNRSLDAVTFLIPMITPGFFKSQACREEMKRFLKQEEKLGRSDLILPVYYFECSILSDPVKRKQDELAQAVAARQYADWRELRFEPFTSPQIGKTFETMAKQIVQAFNRSEVKTAVASSADTPRSASVKFTIERRPTAKAEPPTAVVDALHRGDYVTITEALKAVKAGTRIFVRPGLYREGIVIDKPVEIIGDGERDDIVIEAFDQTTVFFQTNMGRVANLTLRQAGGDQGRSVSIVQGRVDIENCDISSQAGECVAIYNGADPRLRHNFVHHGRGCGIVIFGNNSRGTLEDNDIIANGYPGIVLAAGSNLTLRRNRITENNGAGISVHFGGNGRFEDNDLRGNAKGAWYIDKGCEARMIRRDNKE